MKLIINYSRVAPEILEKIENKKRTKRGNL
jgi:hypothetical protein